VVTAAPQWQQYLVPAFLFGVGPTAWIPAFWYGGAAAATGAGTAGASPRGPGSWGRRGKWTPSAPLPTPDPIPEHGGLALYAVGLVHDDLGRLDRELTIVGGLQRSAATAKVESILFRSDVLVVSRM